MLSALITLDGFDMRLLRTLTAALLIVALGSAMANPRVLDASVEQSEGRYELHWRADVPQTPVDVFVSDRPDAPSKARHLIVDNDTDDRAVVNPAMHGRPYFFVAADKGSGVWVAERLLPLQGGQNFRDLGGYETADGHRVKWGKLYRSGSMADLTAADYDYLAALNIKVVCDLRTAQERQAAPNKWQQAAHVTYWTRDYEEGFGDLGKIMMSGHATPEQIRAAMIDGYRDLPIQQKPAYSELFKRLAAGEIPLAFNCTAGKDRTGTAAALILSALGVPRETIVADYVLTDKTFDASRLQRSKSNRLANIPPEITSVLLRADPDYIRAALDALEKKYGSVEGYVREELGVSESDLRAIRRLLLE